MEILVYSGRSPKESIIGIHTEETYDIDGTLKDYDKFGVNLQFISYKLFDKKQAAELTELLKNNKLKITIEKLGDDK